MPPFLRCLSAHKAFVWNTMVGITFALGALRWVLHR